MDAYDDGIVGLLLVTKLKSKIIVTLLMIALGIYIVRINKRAAKINWKPLIKKIDIILDKCDKVVNYKLTIIQKDTSSIDKYYESVVTVIDSISSDYTINFSHEIIPL